MTDVQIRSKDLELIASGHAGGGEAGKDIVCAGISAITQTLLDTLIEDEDEDKLWVEWEIWPKDGVIWIKAHPKAEHRKETEAYYRMAGIGLKAIAENYPGNIRIKEV